MIMYMLFMIQYLLKKNNLKHWLYLLNNFLLYYLNLVDH